MRRPSSRIPKTLLLSIGYEHEKPLSLPKQKTINSAVSERSASDRISWTRTSTQPRYSCHSQPSGRGLLMRCSCTGTGGTTHEPVPNSSTFGGSALTASSSLSPCQSTRVVHPTGISHCGTNIVLQTYTDHRLAGGSPNRFPPFAAPTLATFAGTGWSVKVMLAPVTARTTSAFSLQKRVDVFV